MSKKTLELLIVVMLNCAFVYGQGYKTVQNYIAASCDNCLLARSGQKYTFTSSDINTQFLPENAGERTVFFGNRMSFPFRVEDIKSNYQIKITYLSDSRDRVIKAATEQKTLNKPLKLPYGKPVTETYTIPAETYKDKYFTLDLIALSGANVAITQMEILSSGSKPLVYEDVLVKQLQTISFVPSRLSPLPANVNGVSAAVISLNGEWDFKYKDQKGKIQVPGEWEMQGFHVDSAEFASYSTSFSLPEDWKDKKVKLRFDAVSSHCQVFVNDKLLGEHEGGFVIFEMDASKAVKPGANKLEVKVASLTISDKLGCVSQYAAHTVGGILRKVSLVALPEVNIAEVYPVVKFDPGYNNAALNINYQIFNESKLQSQASLKFTLFDADGKEVALTGNESSKTIIKSNTALSDKISLKVAAPKKWDTEHPYLYTLVTQLIRNGKVLQENRQKIGFRQIDIRGNQFYINNMPIKLHGANRHDVATLSGRSISTELNLKDALLFRNANCNYIRTSHYPPAEEFLAACDSLGMFVEAEAAITWVEHHASPIWKEWNYLNPEFVPYFLRANFENIRGNRNHPSIIIWSIANESRWSPLWEKVNAAVKKYEPTRPTAFHDQTYGGFNNAGSKADIRNIHYPGLGGPEQTDKFTDRPVLFGEYCHVQTYNRLEEVTDPFVRADWGRMLNLMYGKMYKHQACLGGAIWAGVDDIFHKPDSTIVGYGPWGAVIDGWRREKPEFISVRKSYAPFIISNLESAKPENGVLSLKIQNRYNFTNLNEGMITYTINGVVKNTTVNIPARSEGELKLNVPDHVSSMLITFRDPRGFITQEELLNFKEVKADMPVVENIPVLLKKAGNNLIVSRGSQKYVFDGKTGALANDDILSSLSVMVVPMNGDDGGAPHIAGNNYQRNIKPLLYKPEANWKTSKVTSWSDKNSVRITVTGSYAYLSGAFTYNFLKNGFVEVGYSFKVTDSIKINPRQWGLAFELPDNFQHLNYLRKGYWSIYPETDIARTAGDIEAKPVHLKYVEAPLLIPSGPWSADANDLGSRDFRSTKANIYYASLSNGKGNALTVYSDGTQSTRTWIDGNKTRFLIAELNGGGSDDFFSSYYSKERTPLKVGSELKGVIKFVIK